MLSNLIKLSKALNVKVDYLFRKSTVELNEVTFRKKAKLGSKSIDSIKYRVIDRLERYLVLENILSVDSHFTNPLAAIQINDFSELEVAKLSTSENKKPQKPHHPLMVQVKIKEHSRMAFVLAAGSSHSFNRSL